MFEVMLPVRVLWHNGKYVTKQICLEIVARKINTYMIVNYRVRRGNFCTLSSTPDLITVASCLYARERITDISSESNMNTDWSSSQQDWRLLRVNVIWPGRTVLGSEVAPPVTTEPVSVSGCPPQYLTRRAKHHTNRVMQFLTDCVQLI